MHAELCRLVYLSVCDVNTHYAIFHLTGVTNCSKISQIAIYAWSRAVAEARSCRPISGGVARTMACREASIDCHVLATWSKCVPFSTNERMYGERMEDGFRWREQIFEKVPMAKLDWCINEEGLLPSSQLIDKIHAIRLAKAWNGTVSRP